MDATKDWSKDVTEQPSKQRQPEVADVLWAGANEYRLNHALRPEENRVLRELMHCRDGLFGGRIYKCGECHETTPLYNSCNNRNCPKCGGGKRQRWRDDRLKEMLPVLYYHVVFTIPMQLSLLSIGNESVIYNILFAAVQHATAKTAREWEVFRAQLGFTMILHTWGQQLNRHVHIHAMIPHGGLSLETGLWVDMPEGEFLPAEKMANDFRDRFLTLLQRAFDKGQLKLGGAVETPEHFQELMAQWEATRWITYAAPLSDGEDEAGAFSKSANERTVNYLARYANRAPISNDRILSIEDGYVTFSYTDYTKDRRDKGNATERITVEEFIRRTLLHVLPSRMRSSRNCGYLGNNRRTETLAKIREQLKDRVADEQPEQESVSDETVDEREEQEDPVTVEDLIDLIREGRCPHCNEKALKLAEEHPRPTIQQIFIMPWKDVLAEGARVPAKPAATRDVSPAPFCPTPAPTTTPQLHLPFW